MSTGVPTDPPPTSLPRIPPVSDVRRDEEPPRIIIDHHRLHPGRGRAPQRQTSVTVVIVVEHDECLLAPHEPGRRAVTEPFGRFRQCQTSRPNPFECIHDRQLWRIASTSCLAKHSASAGSDPKGRARSVRSDPRQANP